MNLLKNILILLYNMKKNNEWFLLWFTWLPCSWKTTLAIELNKKLNVIGYPDIEHLDWDILRSDLSSDLSFSKEDRGKNLMMVAFVSKLLVKHNIWVLATFVSPYEEVRNEIRLKVQNFIEVFVSTPLKVCEERDIKWMYKKARNWEIQNFTWVDDPYEEPKKPEIEINTNIENIKDSIDKIVKYLEINNFI